MVEPEEFVATNWIPRGLIEEPICVIVSEVDIVTLVGHGFEDWFGCVPEDKLKSNNKSVIEFPVMEPSSFSYLHKKREKVPW